jgi:hypothetical protein
VQPGDGAMDHPIYFVSQKLPQDERQLHNNRKGGFTHDL